MPGAPINTAFSVLSFIGMVLVCTPLPWHLEHWNIGTVMYMLWTALALLCAFVNSVVWAGSALDVSPAWCQISTRIMLAASIGIPAASLCITLRMYRIASAKGKTSPNAKRNGIITDLAIGLGLPIVNMPLYWVIQSGPYDIFEDYGCNSAISATPMSVPLYWMWPFIISIASGIFGGLSIYYFAQHRAEFKSSIGATANLTSNRYFRLMALAGTDIIFTIPLSLYFLIYACNNFVGPWNWNNVHNIDYVVNAIPAILWRSDLESNVGIELSRWLFVLCAFIFFGFFGFSEEARRHYSVFTESTLRTMGISSSGSVTVKAGATASVTKSTVTSTMRSSSLPVLKDTQGPFSIRKASMDSFITDIEDFIQEKESSPSITPSVHA